MITEKKIGKIIIMGPDKIVEKVAEKITCDFAEFNPEYFWAYEYRHLMRPLPMEGRKEVAIAFTANGLDLEAVSDKHREIINSIRPKYKAYLEKIGAW